LEKIDNLPADYPPFYPIENYLIFPKEEGI